MKIDLNQHFSAEEIEQYEQMMRFSASGNEAHSVLAFQLLQGNENRLFLENFYNTLSVIERSPYRGRGMPNSHLIEYALKRYCCVSSINWIGADNIGIECATVTSNLICPLDFRWITSCHRFCISTDNYGSIPRDELSTIIYPIGAIDGYWIDYDKICKIFYHCNAQTIQQVLENNRANPYAKHIEVSNGIGSKCYKDVYSNLQLRNANIETIQFIEPIDIRFGIDFFSNVTLPKSLIELKFSGFNDRLTFTPTKQRADRLITEIAKAIIKSLAGISNDISLIINGTCLFSDAEMINEHYISDLIRKRIGYDEYPR